VLFATWRGQRRERREVALDGEHRTPMVTQQPRAAPVAGGQVENAAAGADQRQESHDLRRRLGNRGAGFHLCSMQPRRIADTQKAGVQVRPGGRLG
jgi:hypothetical protein